MIVAVSTLPQGVDIDVHTNMIGINKEMDGETTGSD